ncbi:MAG TPA: class I SAM-dependent methyltransferase [Acidimicrobiales bacterium]|nr:class I SAM-dependent methyltransferase [Acidimicrobiales bacterium]
MAVDATYDSIGIGYSRFRQPDPRVEAQILAPLGGARRVLNVGAGSGSYEPTDRVVVAVEPSERMIEQRPSTASRIVVRAVAGDLPFEDDTFDAAMALMTVHHWPDIWAGLAEVRRVTSGPVVVFHYDTAVHAQQWLVTDYLPSMVELDAGVPSPTAVAEALGGGEVTVVPVPHDCHDGFCHAFWRRPEAYLDPTVRASISGIARSPARVVDEAMARLADDLASGRWQRRHADLLTAEEIDAGYRLVVAPTTKPPSRS